jgi:hypothetical protein
MIIRNAPYAFDWVIVFRPLGFFGCFDSTLHLQFGQKLSLELNLLSHSVHVISSTTLVLKKV